MKTKDMNFICCAKIVYTKIFPQFKECLTKKLQDCKTVLDIGCGRKSPIQTSSVSYSVGVDLFKPYLKESKKKKIHTSYVRGDVRRIEFKEKSFDCVVALDVLEHLEKHESLKLIEKMEKWARKKLILLVPNGFQLQDEYDSNPWQVHKSGWSVNELKKVGVTVYGINGLRVLRGDQSQIRFRPKLFWRLISDITQRVTHLQPAHAFSLFCVKDLEK